MVVSLAAGLVGSLRHLAIKRIIVWPETLLGQCGGWSVIAISVLVCAAATLLSVAFVRLAAGPHRRPAAAAFKRSKAP